MTPQNPVCLSGKLQGDALTCILGVMQVSLGTKRDFPHVVALAGWHAAVAVLMTIILTAGSAGKAGAAPEAAPPAGFKASFAERDITPRDDTVSASHTLLLRNVSSEFVPCLYPATLHEQAPAPVRS